MARAAGFEPVAFPVTGGRSNQAELRPHNIRIVCRIHYILAITSAKRPLSSYTPRHDACNS